MSKVYVNLVQFFVLLRMVRGETPSLSVNATTSNYGCSINALSTWQCNNGQCIQFEELCDGIVHCEDKSDETVDQCLDKACPGYAFQCAYGACITGHYKCNGIVDCVDGSDETRFLCDATANYNREMRGSCWLSSQMQCKSGHCLSSEKACDGVKDCPDGSDETVDLCSFLQCPSYAFRCGYGACIAGRLRCNGVIDCADGSDELPGICGGSYATSTTEIPSTTRYPSTTALSPSLDDDHVRPITPRPTAWPSTTRATTTQRTTDAARTRPTQAQPLPKEEMPAVTPAQAEPTPNVSHWPTDSRDPIVSNGTAKFCSAITLSRGISTMASCSLNNLAVSCYHSLRIGTQAVITCAPGYVRENKSNRRTLVCDKDGEWSDSKFRCIPQCGSLSDEQRQAVIKPWDVTIFKRSSEPIFHPICSGIVVSPKVVLTAASCLEQSADEEGSATDHVLYNVLEGIFNLSYSEGDTFSARVHNVSRITIKSGPTSHKLAILIIVNFFRFTDSLKPICLPSIHNNLTFLSDDRLNIGRAVSRDTTREYLEYIIAKIDKADVGRRTSNVEYIRVNDFVPYILREMNRHRIIL